MNKSRFVYIYTDTLIKQAKNCRKNTATCLGDSGDAKCIFCEFCVLSSDEITALIEETRKMRKNDEADMEKKAMNAIWLRYLCRKL